MLFVMLTAAIFGRFAFGRLADLIGPDRAHFIASLRQTMAVFVFSRNKHLAYVHPLPPVHGFGRAGVMTTVLVIARC